MLNFIKNSIINLFFLLFFSCAQEKKETESSKQEESKFEINESLHITMTPEDSLLVKSIIQYTKDINDVNFNHMDSWFYSDSSSKYPYFDLFKNIEESSRIQVLAITEKEGFKMAKLAFFNGTNIETLFNVPAIPSKERGYIFLNYYDTFERVEPQQYNNIRYFNHSQNPINQEDVNQMIGFGKKLAQFFNQPEINFDYYMFSNSKQMFKVLGYDYEPNMFDAYQRNAFCRPADLSIFSGNETAKNPHELAHLYIHSFVGNGESNAGNPNRYLDEGFATYLGGAQDQIPLGKATLMALNFFQTHEVCFGTKEELGFIIEDIINFKNVFYGNLIMYLIDYQGANQALNAVARYKTDQDLDILITSLMLPEETFNDFVFRIIMSNNFDKE